MGVCVPPCREWKTEKVRATEDTQHTPVDPSRGLFVFGSLFLVLGYSRTLVFRTPVGACVLKILCVSNACVRDVVVRSFVNVACVVYVCFMFVNCYQSSRVLFV